MSTLPPSLLVPSAHAHTLSFVILLASWLCSQTYGKQLKQRLRNNMTLLSRNRVCLHQAADRDQERDQERERSRERSREREREQDAPPHTHTHSLTHSLTCIHSHSLTHTFTQTHLCFACHPGCNHVWRRWCAARNGAAPAGSDVHCQSIHGSGNGEHNLGRSPCARCKCHCVPRLWSQQRWHVTLMCCGLGWLEW